MNLGSVNSVPSVTSVARTGLEKRHRIPRRRTRHHFVGMTQAPQAMAVEIGLACPAEAPIRGDHRGVDLSRGE